MSYQVLYRTYRPAKFEEVVGQDYIIKILKNAIKSNKIAHAYLFAGPRGTGKTTIAKLFAKAINCESFKEEACDECDSCIAFNNNSHPDIIEMDAASNNGVDNIREIVEQVNYAPILGKYKIYIIDEAHMLSDSAFNALLKTLEEPPTHVIFILATTDPEKIIPTVLSRCQRYNFSKISKFNMKKKMIEILNKENLKYDEEAIDEIATMAEGGMRDALSILEQMLSYNDSGVYKEDVLKVFGLSTTEEKINLLNEVHSHNIASAIKRLRDIYQAGKDVKKLAIDLLEIIKEALIYSDDADEKLLNKINPVEAKSLLDSTNIQTLLNDINTLKEVLINNRINQNFLSYLELAFIKMANNQENNEIKKIENNKPTIKEEKKKEIVKEIIKEEKIIDNKVEKEEIINNVENVIGEDNNYIAALLLGASKSEKINDAIIFNKLDLYKNEVDKRKYYELLNKAEHFASNKDAIIIFTENDAQANNINSPEIRKELYSFIMNEFNINKVIVATNKDNKKDIVNLYRELAKEKSNEMPTIEKPEIKKARTNEEKLKELFGEVKVK